MSTTYRFMAFDMLETFKQINDDSEIQITQVIFWINVIANRLRMQHIRKLPTGTHLLTFNGVKVEIDPVTGKRFVTLPKSIYDFKHDKGIEYITYDIRAECCDGPAFTEVVFNHTTATKSRRLYFNPHEKPSEKNP